MDFIVNPSVVLASAAALALAARRFSASIRHAFWVAALASAALLPLAPSWEVFSTTASPSIILQYVPVETSSPVTDQTQSVATLSHGFVTGTPRITPRGFLVIVWLAGILAVSSRLLLGILAARRLIRASTEWTHPEWLGTLDELRTSLGVSETVSLSLSNKSISPMTSGIFRSAIVLPSDARHWTEERRRMVVAHELAHVKRRDRFIQVFAQLVCAAYWFNPLVWYAARCLRAERERACDDHVLKLGTDPFTYAAQLVEIARSVSTNRMLSAVTICMAQPSQLESRLRAIMDSRRSRKTLSGPATGLLCSGIAAAVLLVAGIHVTAMPLPVLRVSLPSIPQPPQTGPEAAAPPLSIAPPRTVEPQTGSFYLKWLAEDVAYIITDEEKQAFTALKTEVEREQFIEQFWSTRNKAQHDQRVAYANAAFSVVRPGWQTDRGRILILFGLPNSKVKDAGGPGTYAYETWTYTFLPSIGNNVQFEFVDPARNQEFRLNSTPNYFASRIPGLVKAVPPEIPAWAGTWVMNREKSKFTMPVGGAQVPGTFSVSRVNPFESYLMKLEAQPSGVRADIDMRMVPPLTRFRTNWVVDFQFGREVKSDEMFFPPSQPPPYVFTLKRMDSESLQIEVSQEPAPGLSADAPKARYEGFEVLQTVMPGTNMVMLEVSPDGNTLTVRNTRSLDSYLVFERQQ